MKRFMCLVYVDDSVFDGLPREGHLRMDEENRAFDASLRASGHLIDTSAMASTRDAVTIRRRGGKLSTTDGPFAETKEHLGGYFLFRAKDREEAVAIMSRDPMADYASLEVREVKDIRDPDWRDWADQTFGAR